MGSVGLANAEVTDCVACHPPHSCRVTRDSYTWDLVKGSYHDYDEDANNATAVVELAHVPRSLAGKCFTLASGSNLKQCPKGNAGRKLGTDGVCVFGDQGKGVRVVHLSSMHQA